MRFLHIFPILVVLLLALSRERGWKEEQEHESRIKIVLPDIFGYYWFRNETTRGAEEEEEISWEHWSVQQRWRLWNFLLKQFSPNFLHNFAAAALLKNRFRWLQKIILEREKLLKFLSVNCSMLWAAVIGGGVFVVIAKFSDNFLLFAMNIWWNSCSTSWKVKGL